MGLGWVVFMGKEGTKSGKSSQSSSSVSSRVDVHWLGDSSVNGAFTRNWPLSS